MQQRPIGMGNPLRALWSAYERQLARSPLATQVRRRARGAAAPRKRAQAGTRASRRPARPGPPILALPPPPAPPAR
jgi:hypothetical protein